MKRPICALAILTLLGLGAAAQKIQTIPANDVGEKAIILGNLRTPVGSTVRLRVTKTKFGPDDTRLVVNEINGKQVVVHKGDAEMSVSTSQIRHWPEGTKAVLIGQEVGRLRYWNKNDGNLDDNDPRFKPRQRLFLDFVAIEVVEPKNLELRDPTARADDATYLAALKANPTESVDAATWFMGLPADKKKAYAAKLGTIVLEAGKSPDEFVVAFGADKAPYPWAFCVGKNRLDLSEDNSFDFVLRDDEHVKKQWGVHWTSSRTYDTETRDGRVFFKRGTARDYGSLWIPATNWRYVGPKLIKSKDVLGPANSPGGNRPLPPDR